MATSINDLSERIMEALRRNNDLHQLSRKSGVDRGALLRFMRGGPGAPGLTLPAISKLCNALGLNLVPDEKPASKAAPPGTPPADPGAPGLEEAKQPHPQAESSKPVAKKARKK